MNAKLQGNPFVESTQERHARYNCQVSYWDTVDKVVDLRDQEIRQLLEFAKGLTTVKELPPELSTIARNILEHPAPDAMTLLKHIRDEVKKRVK